MLPYHRDTTLSTGPKNREYYTGTFAIPAFTFEFNDVNNPEEKKYKLTTEPIDIRIDFYSYK